MKLVTALLACCALCAATPDARAAAGIYDSFVFVTSATGSTPSPVNFYDLGASSASPDFQGANLGTFDLTDSLRVGGQQKSYKNSFTDVVAHDLFFRVYPSSSPSGTFTSTSYAFQADLGGGDQRWGGDLSGSNSTFLSSGNLLSGLTVGTYVLEVFSRITTNQVNEAQYQYVSNNGNNYKATFTVVPEPANALAGILLGVGLLLRRRATFGRLAPDAGSKSRVRLHA